MKLNKIEDLIKQGESNTLEFKTSTAKIKSAFETICGYLNAKGGTVLIGVKNNKQIVGQHVTDQTMLEIANYISKIEPAVSIDVDYVPVSESKFVIKITAKPSPNPSSIPYIFDGKPFWRVESSTKPMPQQHYHQLLMEKAHKTDSWELAKATKGGSISFLMYSDRLEITSHGILPLGIAIEDFKHTHESQPRNERIAQVMYKRGVIESVGTGTEEMIKECRTIGKPDPTYLERGNTFVVCFKAKGIADIVEPRLLQKINERQKAILGMLLDTGPSSSTEIIKGLGLTIVERTLRRDLNQLLDLGLVKVKGRGAGTLWYLSASNT